METDARTLPAGPALDEMVSAFEALVALAEEIEDEWLFVNDLSTEYGGRLEELRSAFGGAELPADTVGALEELAAEVRLIKDPHKAIDWLSTYPAVAALALEGAR